MEGYILSHIGRVYFEKGYVGSSNLSQERYMYFEEEFGCKADSVRSPRAIYLGELGLFAVANSLGTRLRSLLDRF